MPATLSEKFESRIVTTGASPSGERRYSVFDADTESAVLIALRDGSPVNWDLYGDGGAILVREALSVSPVSDTLWDAVATYGLYAYASSFAFDTGGGTQHITQSRSTVARYAPPGKTAPNFHGAIGVTADGVEGVDIAVPVYQFQETHYLADGVVTTAYKSTLFALTGQVNSAPFKGLAAGECLFLGAAGQKRGLDAWEVTFKFAGSPNLSGFVIGEITEIAKKGWEYLWVRYQDLEDTTAKALVKKPVAVYVEEVLPYGDFALLGIGT